MAIAIEVKDLDKRYGPQVIFERAEVAIGENDRAGVVGRNGAGKSTLCRLVTGVEEPDSGRIRIHPRVRLGYLEQQPPYEPGETVVAFLERYTGKERWECGKAAGRFQIKGAMLDTAIAELAGGFQTRVKLAALILGAPDFLVLDEPTNHLDLRTLVLLERFLNGFSGGYLIVSHDREFLKRTCDKTLEIAGAAMTLFPGAVEEYLAYRDEQRELDERRNRNVEAKRRHLQEFVDRYRVRAATASRAQSKLKQIEKLERVEIASAAKTVQIRLPDVDVKKGIALSLEELEIGYPENSVASGIHADIERGERVAVVGNNGEGKTTFLRTIAGDLDALGGELRWGYGMRTAYYAQHVYATLREDLTVEQHLASEAAPDVTRQEILDLAGSFLFRGDDVLKGVDCLSGGERARLCLAGLLLSKRPVLLLDEPTNHLDFETVEALGRALAGYRGTLIFVSHDRSFVNLVATTIFEVQSGRITKFPGDYATYVWRIERETDEAEKSDAAEAADLPASPASKRPDDYTGRKRRRARIQKLEKEIRALERALDAHGAERSEIDAYYLAHPTEYSPAKQARLEEIERLVATAESEWVARHEELEALRDLER